MPDRDPHAPDVEHRYHNYSGKQIPWYVRLLWIGFWCFAVYYTIRYLFPDLQAEFLLRK